MTREEKTNGRRAHRLARRLGFEIAGVAPGAAVVSRSAGYEVEPVGGGGTYLVRRKRKGAARLIRLKPGVTVVVDGPDRASIRRVKLNDHAWIVGILRSSRRGVEVAKAGSRGWIVAQRDPSPQAELLLEKQITKLLGERHVAWLLARYQVDCVLDVGANTGQYGQALRQHGYDGHIISFEPVPEFVDALEQASADDDKWSVQHLALGSEEGTVPIRVQRSFSSLLTSSDYGKRRFPLLQDRADSEQIDVPLRRLDAVLDELLAPVIASGVKNPRIYLKMDTQGFDLEVFRGLGERVSDIVGMQSEVALLLIYDEMPRMPEALATYEAAGFEITGLYPVSHEPDGRVIEYDCTMIRASALP